MDKDRRGGYAFPTRCVDPIVARYVIIDLSSVGLLKLSPPAYLPLPHAQTRPLLPIERQPLLIINANLPYYAWPIDIFTLLGPRICIGMELALTQLRLVCVFLVRTLDI